MAATTGGAVKAGIEQAGLGVPVFRDRAPDTKPDGTDFPLPFVVVFEGITRTPVRTGDNKSKRMIEQVQVDLYENIKNPDGSRAESYTLASDLSRALANLSLPDAPFHIFASRLFNSFRVPSEETNSIRNTYTVNVYRNI